MLSVPVSMLYDVESGSYKFEYADMDAKKFTDFIVNVYHHSRPDARVTMDCKDGATTTA